MQGGRFLPLHCDDQMGLSSGEMGTHQISTSSDLSPEHDKESLKLNGTSSWQPLTNSPTEWIQVKEHVESNIKEFNKNYFSSISWSQGILQVWSPKGATMAG